MRIPLGVVASGICLLTGAAMAQTHALPFGLEKFHWGMPETEAAAIYPTLGPNAPPDPTLSNMRSTGFKPVRWQGCDFEVNFHFAAVNGVRVLAEMDMTILNATGFFRENKPLTRCPQAMRDSLNIRYGAAPLSNPGDGGTEWKEIPGRPWIRFWASGDLGRVVLHGPGMPGRAFYDTIEPSGAFGAPASR
jgi:hypothetical protein